MSAAQGTIDWYIERLGNATASDFSRILGSHRTRQRYYQELTDERLVLKQGHAAAEEYVRSHQVDGPALAWGRAQEPRARAAYELLTGEEVEEVGFMRYAPAEGAKALSIGCSLDGTVGWGTIEIKSPYRLENHIATVRNGMPAKHLPQVQGGLWIAQRRWCDFISWHPDYQPQPLYIQRVQRDPAYIDMLSTRVLAFMDAVVKGKALPEHLDDDKPRDVIPMLF